MKRLKPVKLKTTVLGRGGRKRKLSVPLTILRNEVKAIESSGEVNTGMLPESTDVSKDLFRKTNSFVNWTVCREKILNAFLESSAMLDGANCVVCHERSATIRCPDCGPFQVFCKKCSTDLHLERNQFHVLELWQEDKFIPLYPDHGVISYGHKCATQIRKPFTLIDFYGRHHLKYVEVCNCESTAATLVRLNFWPGSPEKPSVAFHMNLMRLCEKLFLQCHVSLFNFVEVLKALHPPLHPTLVSSIYSILNSGCFEEFRQFQYRCKYITDTDNGSICPLCPEDNGTIIESMDACMGLARKRSKGTQKGQLRHSSLFFNEQSDVDHFVDSYTSEGAVIEKDCSRFHAGEVLSSLRSKGKNKIFEEKGIFGRVCRHDYPKDFLNLKYGERISYSVYELQKLKTQFTGKNVSIIVMYDIACILEKHLKNSKQENLLDGIGLSIPIFHCYGHKASCQIRYSPRRSEGVGLTDGEGVEGLVHGVGVHENSHATFMLISWH